MKISVIVTTHNRPYYLDKVLSGYLHQTELPHEIVVADDGSTDSTPDVIEKYRRIAPFPIVHTWQRFVGKPQVAKARNAATRASSGDYLIYTDGDCIPGPHFVADHRLAARPGSFVQGRRNFLRYKAFETFSGQENRWQLLKYWATGGLSRAHVMIRIPGFALPGKGVRGIRSCNLAVYRRDVEVINGWNEQFFGCWREDSEFATRLLRSGVRRRNVLFSAVTFHMEHEKTVGQEELERNEILLEEAQSGPLFVKHGLIPASETLVTEAHELASVPTMPAVVTNAV